MQKIDKKLTHIFLCSFCISKNLNLSAELKVFKAENAVNRY